MANESMLNSRTEYDNFIHQLKPASKKGDKHDAKPKQLSALSVGRGLRPLTVLGLRHARLSRRSIAELAVSGSSR